MMLFLSDTTTFENKFSTVHGTKGRVSKPCRGPGLRKRPISGEDSGACKHHGISLRDSLPWDSGQEKGAGAGVGGMILRPCPPYGRMSLDSHWPAILKSPFPLPTPLKGS